MSSYPFLIVYHCNKCGDVKFLGSNDGVLPADENVDLTHMKTQLHVGTYYCGIFEQSMVMKACDPEEETISDRLDRIEEMLKELTGRKYVD